MSSRKVQVVPSSAIPQFDSIERIFEAVTVRSRGVLSEDTIDLSHRHVNYVKQAARLLGLLSSTNDLTAIAERAISLGPEPRRQLLRRQFENGECGQAWLAWAGASTLDELDPESGAAFLEACTELPAGMVARRGRTLRRWVEALQARDATTPTRSSSGSRSAEPTRRPRSGRGSK
jgi:hypothetical protein